MPSALAKTREKPPPLEDLVKGWRELVRTDPLNFSKEALRLKTLWWGAEKIIRSVFTNRRTAVKSGHSLSKDWAAGICALQWLLTYHPSKVICTGPKFDHVTRICFEEIAKQFHRLQEISPFPVEGDPLKKTGLYLGPEWYAFGMTTKEAGDSMGKFMGFKSPHLLLIMTEAQGIQDNIFDQIYGLTTGSHYSILEIGNPIKISGRFWQHCTQPKWGYEVITLSCFDSPNVEAGYEKYPGLVTNNFIEDMRRIWGEDHPYWYSRVLGEFPQASSKALIPMDWILRARNREFADNDQVIAAGHDVAGDGTAETVIVVLEGKKVKRIETFHKMDIASQVGWAKAIIREEKVELYAVDEGGLAGISSFLEEERLSALRIKFGESADSEEFDNVAAEMYWNLRLAFERNEISIPDDEILMGQLASREFDYTSRGKRKISLEPKAEAAKRGQKHYDRSDALALAWWARAMRFREIVGSQEGMDSESSKIKEIHRSKKRDMEEESSGASMIESDDVRY